jgi:hypothetical protein
MIDYQAKQIKDWINCLNTLRLENQVEDRSPLRSRSSAVGDTIASLQKVTKKVEI